MKTIKLSKGQVALVDDDDFEYLSQFNWHSSYRRGYCYAARKLRKKDGKWTNIYMHREIFNIKSKFPIDHIDGDRLNNQKNNLRICNNNENLMNRSKQKNNTSGFKGVFHHLPKKNKKNPKWLAQLRYNGVQIYLGIYKTKKEAALAYNKGAIKYCGKFAKLNIIK